jgi:hypothetical protein
LAAPAPKFSPIGTSFLEKHCFKCHSGKEPKAELSLDTYRNSGSLIEQRKVWDNVRKMITAGEMPPKGRPQPPVAEAEVFIDLVKAVFDYADQNAKPDPGRITMRRLNRVEYRNTIRDLTGVNFDPTEDFPSDDIGHGFDNIGDVLTLPPVLMERYLAASEAIMSQAILPNPPPVIKRHLKSIYTEPASADSAKLAVNGFRPMRTDGKRHIDVGPIHTPYKFETGAEYIFRTRVYAQNNGEPLKVTVLLYGKDLVDPSPDAELDKLLGGVMRPARILKTFQVRATTIEDAQILEVHVPALANRQRMLVAIDKKGEDQPTTTLWIEYLALEGPLDSRPASHRRLLASTGTSQVERTREVMNRFLRQAFRRPTTEDELDRSIHLVDLAMTEGDQWEAGIQFAMQAALCSPKFLFRVEQDNDPSSPKIRNLDEFQLASRLSYFLWSSMPDNTLMELAEKRQLTANLDSQVRRLLNDPRASSLVENFAMQWLQLQRIDFISPDGRLFPTFNVKLRSAMVRETELFIESIIREDRSILDLIDADYTFLNEPLAMHYGIADTAGNPIGEEVKRPGGRKIKGETFQRISLQNRNRGGLLTQASVLTVTSNPTRTSPVKRGRWVLEQILGAPPPSPPANVPELSEENENISSATLRERMETHRRKPTCANCHAKMDPIGFALENFDAVGAWRTKDGTFDIDATGEFPDGTKFSGPAELKAIVMSRKEGFTRCLVEKMLTYALGRGIQYYDRPTIEKIVQALPVGKYRFSVLVTQIVNSDAFRQRRGL